MFENLLSKLEDESKESIILGDFNCNLLEKPRAQHTSKLESLYNEYQYKQLIKEPTSITRQDNLFSAQFCLQAIKYYDRIKTLL